MVGTARLECGEPAAEAGELVRRQLGDGFGDFFDFHGAHYTRLGRPMAYLIFIERLRSLLLRRR